MRPLFLTAAFVCFASTGLFAAKESPGGALGAIKALPKGEWKRIARIEARDGTPVPERWHIIVHDPKDENGVHEYVIAGGELVASRNISQFVEFVKPEDVLSSSMLKVDSNRVADLAQAYALANHVTIAALNYALKKEGVEAALLWNVSCLDEMGREVGRLVISAGKGTVVSHEGFTAEPGAEEIVETQSPTQVDRDGRQWRRPPRKPSIVRNTRPVPAPTPVSGERKSIFGRMGEFFTGKPPERR